MSARGLFSSWGGRGLLFVVVHGLLIAVTSLVVEHGLWVCRLQWLWVTGSGAQAWWWLWCMGLAAPQHVGSSQARAWAHVPCIGRQILGHCATREVLEVSFDVS